MSSSDKTDLTAPIKSVEASFITHLDIVIIVLKALTQQPVSNSKTPLKVFTLVRTQTARHSFHP